MTHSRLAVSFAALLVLGCSAPEPNDATAELEERIAYLEDRNAELVVENVAVQARLDACTKCRTMNIQAFDAFGQSSAYPEATDDTITDALALLEERVAARKPGEKLAIVLDIDETVLSNLEQLDGSDYCYDKAAWNVWVDTGVPKPIDGAMRLYDWAREHEIAIMFLSGRKEPQRAATERALKDAGFTQWTELLLRGPEESELKAAEYKAGRRAQLEEQGYAIVLNLGDQASDLAGGHAEQSLLMPNPFYQVL
jgi:5'-nucleotidase (lipoprotein e(P4) family)